MAAVLFLAVLAAACGDDGDPVLDSGPGDSDAGPDPDGGPLPDPDGGPLPDPDGGPLPDPDGGPLPDPDGGPPPDLDGGPAPEPDGGPPPEPDGGPPPIDAGPPDGGPPPPVDAGPAGCYVNADCAATHFCRKADGDCDGVGTCQARPFICPGIFAPVCGCDGATHSSACNARSAGSSVAYSGECTP